MEAEVAARKEELAVKLLLARNVWERRRAADAAPGEEAVVLRNTDDKAANFGLSACGGAVIVSDLGINAVALAPAEAASSLWDSPRGFVHTPGLQPAESAAGLVCGQFSDMCVRGAARAAPPYAAL